ncbi:MAG: site-2 protease family protein [Fibrobacterota bacterium]
MNLSPELLLIRFAAILPALTVHEISHGAAALYFGDHTAANSGRLTPNPFAHLDPIGTLMLFFGPFGWARPVPVNSRNLRNPRIAGAWVAFAGSASNFVMAAAAGLIFRFGGASFPTGETENDIFDYFLMIFFIINIGIGIFNLIPVYPLDGSRILTAFLSGKTRILYFKIMRYVPPVLIAALVFEWAFDIRTVSLVLGPLFKPALQAFQFIFIGEVILK